MTPSLFAEASKSFEKILFMFLLTHVKPGELRFDGYDLAPAAVHDRITFHRQRLGMYFDWEPPLREKFRVDIAVHFLSAKLLACMAVNSTTFDPPDLCTWTFDQVIDPNFFPGGNDETHSSASA